MNKIKPLEKMSIKEIKGLIIWAEREILIYEGFINKLKKESRGRRK